jgi:hypothetical protein
MTTESDKATATRAPAQRTGSGETAAVRTVVMAPGVELDQETDYALTQLRDRQEARLLAHNRTEMALRRASQPHLLPAPDGPAPTPIDTSSLHELVEWPSVEPLVEEMRSPTDAFTVGEFRPLQTELRKEGGLGAENLSDGTHFFGSRHWGGDDLIRFSVGATSHFVLPPEAIPPTTSSGRLRSAPPADVRGTVFGQTGYYFPPFAADDKWCHCYRVTRHALWQLVGGQWRALGESVERQTIVHLENVVQVGNQIVPMSGFMRTPSIDFGLVTRTEPVWAQVEIRFDVDLEGDARIELSPQNNPANSVVVRAFGWWARPI